MLLTPMHLIIKSILILLLIFSMNKILVSKDISSLEIDCKEKGFKEGSEKFKSCVMDLYNKKILLEDKTSISKS